ncbi:MAG: LysM peptidoglycan-binding domain-containing protein [Rudaea sp.]
MRAVYFRPLVLAGVILALLLSGTGAPAYAQVTPTINSPAAPPAAGFACTYIVRPGDTLFRISLRLGVPIPVLQGLNGIANPNLIFVGMPLSIPCVSPFPVPPAAVCAFHTVRFGEDLFRIALRYGTTWPALASFNRLVNPNLIFAGMRLAIPCAFGSRAFVPNPYGAAPGSTAPSTNPYAPAPVAPPAPTMPSQQGTNVTIADFTFSPASITIHVGQTITWKNSGPSPHTVTSNTGAWDSGTLNAGASFSRTFNTAGTFAYHCSIHPMMMGTVVVMP